MQLSSTWRLGGLLLGQPVAFGIALIIVWWAVTLLLATGLPRLSPAWFPDLRSTLVNLGALPVPLAVVGAFGWWRQAGLALPRPGRSWLTLLLLLFFALSFAAGGLSGSPTQLLSSAILFLAFGLNEALLYRGVIQHATNTLGAVRSVVWVALLFGLQHAGTGIFFGHPLYDMGTMMISSTASGAAYAAVMLRMGTIWPLAFLHGQENFCNTRSPGDAPWWGGTYRKRSFSFYMRRGCSAGSTLPNSRKPSTSEVPGTWRRLAPMGLVAGVAEGSPHMSRDHAERPLKLSEMPSEGRFLGRVGPPRAALTPATAIFPSRAAVAPATPRPSLPSGGPPPSAVTRGSRASPPADGLHERHNEDKPEQRQPTPDEGDREPSVSAFGDGSTGEAFIYVAMTRLMLRWLAREQDFSNTLSETV